MAQELKPGLRGIAYSTLDDTVFNATKWELYDWSMLLQQHPTLASLAGRAAEQGISLREAYFALSGCQVVGEGPVAVAWEAVLDTPPWRAAIAKARSELDRAAFLRSIVGSMLERALSETGFSELIPDPDPDGLNAAFCKEVSPLTAIARNAPAEEDIADGMALVALVRAVGVEIGKETDTPEEALNEIMALASMLDLQQLSSMLGFANRVIRGAARKAEGGTEEMTGYSSSGWCDKVVPQDMLAVVEGDLHALVRLSEGQLTTRDFTGQRPMGKGPVVLLRDETGSTIIGGVHARLLGLEVALANAFNKDGRDLVTIAWGDARTRQYTWGEIGLKEHLSAFIRGRRTEIVPPLKKALLVAREYVSGADILIVTDGMIHDAKSAMRDRELGILLQAFRDEGGRVWAIVVGNLDPENWAEKLPICDGVVGMKQVLAGDVLGALLSDMASRAPAGSKKRRL